MMKNSCGRRWDWRWLQVARLATLQTKWNCLKMTLTHTRSLKVARRQNNDQA